VTSKALAHTSFVCKGQSSVAKASHVTYLDVLLPFPGSNQSTELLPLVAAEDITVAHFGAAGQCVTKKQCMKRARMQMVHLSSRCRANDVTAAFFSRLASREPGKYT
jgi:hypothetical protein